MANQMTYHTALADTGTEVALLASIFESHGGNLLELSESVRLNPKDFVDSRHQMIYGSMVALHKTGKPVDAVNVRGYLRDHGAANNVKLLRYVADLAITRTDGAKNSWNTWAVSLRDKSNRRRLLFYLQTMESKAADPNNNLDQLLDGLADNARTAASVMGDIQPRSWADIVQDWRQSLGKGADGVKTGIYSLDSKITQFSAGDLVLVSGRPSMGKTAVLVQFYISACRAGKHCLFFSLEMAEQQIVGRIAANLSHVNSRAFKATGNDFSKDLAKKADDVVSNGYMSNGTIITPEFAGPVGVLEISRYIRCYKRLWGRVDAVYVDYLGKMREGAAAKRQNANVNYAMGSITSDLKELAKREQVAVILGSQLSRKCEERQDKRPMLSDLRDSGEIEQDADTVIGLYRDAYYHEDTLDDALEMIVLKNREGPTGKVMARYTKEESRVEEMDSDAMAVYKAITAETEAKKEKAEKKKEANYGQPLLGDNDAPPPSGGNNTPWDMDDSEIPF